MTEPSQTCVMLKCGRDTNPRSATWHWIPPQYHQQSHKQGWYLIRIWAQPTKISYVGKHNWCTVFITISLARLHIFWYTSPSEVYNDCDKEASHLSTHRKPFQKLTRRCREKAVANPAAVLASVTRCVSYYTQKWGTIGLCELHVAWIVSFLKMTCAQTRGKLICCSHIRIFLYTLQVDINEVTSFCQDKKVSTEIGSE